MALPLSQNWGHLGTKSIAQFAQMSASTFALQQVNVDQGNGTVQAYLSNGLTWVPLGGVTAGSAITFVSNPLSVSQVVKGVAGDPGMVAVLFCVSSAGGLVTMRNGANVAGALLGPLWGGGGASGLALTAGQYVVLGAAVDSPNGIFIEIVGTGTYLVVYQ